MHDKVSIVVLNWNGKKFVDPFMNSYQKIDYPKDKLELIFADNDSSDDSLDYLKKQYGHLDSLKIVQNGGNYGYAGGNNRGIHHATGDYVLVCNNDLKLDKSVVKELLKVSKEFDADVVVPKLVFLNKPGYINNAGSTLMENEPWPIKEIGINEKDDGRFDEIREITAFCGACVLFKRDFLEKIGLFDAKFFMYFEDGDLSWRGQKAGRHFYYAPEAIAYHEHTGTSKEGSPLFNHYVGRNLLLILAKNARLAVFLKGFKSSFRIHFLMRFKNILRSLFGKYGKKHALMEFYLSQKMLWDFARLLPYVLLKRWKILGEEKL